MSKVKELGQVYTPEPIASAILDMAGYHGEAILGKHVIDNSCGNGAILVEVVKRYIDSYRMFRYSELVGCSYDLSNFIHGVELDNVAYVECVKNLDELVASYGIEGVTWDIHNSDALVCDKFDGAMDYVLGNPPYVSLRNVKNDLSSFEFCQDSRKDLYLAFYELGLRMLKDGGVLSYITPSSFYTSKAGSRFRAYLRESKCMGMLLDLGHYTPFTANTYTAIVKLCKGKSFSCCKCFKITDELNYHTFSLIPYKTLFIGGNIVLSDDNEKWRGVLECEVGKDSEFVVKNGFCTMNDGVFMAKSFPFSEHVIDVCKGSTGVWFKCLYPYDDEGNLIPFNQLSRDVQSYLLERKDCFASYAKGASDWYGFGRSQAIKDVRKVQYAVSGLVKDVPSIKFNRVGVGQGCYSCLYVLTDTPEDELRRMIMSEDFIDYVKVLGQYKKGGYYTFSAKDLARYLNSQIKS